MADAEAFVGTDRYVVQRRLGSGAFGVVYEAYDRRERSQVALKVLRMAEADALYRFKKGFRSLADLRHPNLVSFYELATYEGAWFFSMELIDGTDLVEALCGEALCGEALRGDAGGSADEGCASTEYERIRHLLLQLAAGLRALHRSGKVHRDIKPPNILVTPDDELKLLDFGLATELQRKPPGTEREVQMVGTPAYMAPEQAHGDVNNPASDWYGVGVVLYRILTGRLPFHGPLMAILTKKLEGPANDAVRRHAPDVPKDLEELTLGLLRPDPAERWTAEQVLLHLRPTADEEEETDVPFVGRQGELVELRRALAASRSRPVFVSLHGSSGMGKSALVARFLDEVEEREPEAVLLSGRCYVQESVPYKALDAVVDALSRYLFDLHRHEVEVLLPTQMAALARLFPVLSRVPAVADAPRPTDSEPLTPRALRRRAFGALRELVARLAMRKTLVVAVDDLQWGDVDSFVVLDQLFGSEDPPPFLFVGAYRREDAARSPFLAHLECRVESGEWPGVDVRSLALGELSRDEARELLRGLGSESRDETEEILREGAGSPLFLTELARWSPRRLDRREGPILEEARRHKAKDPAAADLPTIEIHLRDVILGRLGRLGDAARRLLEVVAVAGQPVELAVARDAAGVGSDALSAVAELRTGRLVRLSKEGDVDYLETYHDRIREAVMDGIRGSEGEEGLRRRHGRLAEALESAGDADPETLAMHFRATEEGERAYRYAVDAARRAEEALAFDRAARLYRLGLDLGPPSNDERYELEVGLGRALAGAGRSRDAAETFLEAVGHSGTVDPLDVQRHAAEKLLISGHIDRGLKVLRHVMRTVGLELQERRWWSLLRIWWLRLRLHFRLRRLDLADLDGGPTAEAPEADDPELLRRMDVCWSVVVGLCLVDVLHASEFHARHLHLALDAGEPERVARGLALEVFFGAMEGTDADAALARAREAAGRVAGEYAASLTEMAAGMLACSRGQWSEAARRLGHAERRFSDVRRGVSWELDTVRQFRTLALLHLGRWPELFRELPELLETSRQRGDLYLEVHLSHWVAALQAVAEDRVADAEETLASSLEGWSQEGFHYQHFGRLVAQCRLLLYQGRGRDAWRRVKEAWPGLEASMIQRIEMVLVQSHDLRGRCAVAAVGSCESDDEVERAEHLEQAEADARRLERAGTSWTLGLARTLRAGVASLRGELESTLEHLAVAETAFDAAEMIVHAAVVRRRRGQLLRAAEEIEAADESLRTAVGIRRPESVADVIAPGRWDG